MLVESLFFSVKEVAESPEVFVLVGEVGLGMFGAVGDPEGLPGGLGFVESVDHLGGDEGVGAAMNEHHGVGRAADGIKG